MSMRIHNASSRVEPSLKFDVYLVAKEYPQPNRALEVELAMWYMENTYLVVFRQRQSKQRRVQGRLFLNNTPVIAIHLRNAPTA